MTSRIPIHLGSMPTDARADVSQGSAAPPTAFVATLGVAALWVVLTSGLALVSTWAFGMTAREAWVYAIALVSYVAGFAGMVVGLVWVLTHETQ
jgi:hypothetical protein